MQKRILNLRPSLRHFAKPLRPALTLSPYAILPNEMTLELSAVKDQGQTGTCYANAAATCMEYDNTKNGHAPVDLSRLFIAFNTCSFEGDSDPNEGCANLADTAKAIEEYGACNEQLWPFDTTKIETKPPFDCYKAGKLDLLKQFHEVPQVARQMMLTVVNKFPFLVGMAVYNSMMTDQVAAIGLVPMPTADDTIEGGHAVVCYGYVIGQYWKMRNSWGTDWGMHGDFTLPWDYLLNGNLAYDFLLLN
jgi:C1A family cysteine protease